MKSKDLQPLKVSLHGMNERMHKMMVHYLRLPCRGIAIAVDDDQAHAEIVDVDLSPSESLLEERLAQQPTKPIIALSLNEISLSGVIYVKKPIEVPEVLAAFALAKDVILGKTSLEKTEKPVDTPSKASPVHNEPKTPSALPLESNKNVESNKNASDIITEALKKSETTGKLSGQQKYLHNILHHKVALDDTKQQPEKSLPLKKPGLHDLKKAPSVDQPTPESSKSSSTQPKSEQFKDKSEIAPPNLKTKAPEETKKLSRTEKPEPLRSETENFEHNKTPTQEEIVQANETPPLTDDNREPQKTFEKALSKNKNKPPFDQSVALKQPASEQPITTNEPSAAKPDKDQRHTKEKTKPISPDKLATPQSSNSFLNAISQRKGLITGLTCLFTLLAGIYIFQLPSLYETRARIFISHSNAKNIDKNSSSTEDTLNNAVAEKVLNELTSRQLAGQVIKTLQLNTIPAFSAAASINADTQVSTPKITLERLEAEQVSGITDYFLQNLKVSQFKNSPIINIDYKAEDPSLAVKIVTQLIDEYIALQQEKKRGMADQLADWETNQLPAARDQVEQSQNALELYVEMNKWSQFEQQFAEDMGVNSEIRALEKKLKADITLYEVLLERYENFKKDNNSMEAKLISSAELPTTPSYPNKLGLLLTTLISAILIAVLIAYILSALNFGRKKVIGESI
jgi:uncharacterized protein involved in exopolysaccharide biosynthesis